MDFSVDSPQVGFGELPFNRVDRFPTYPDICFRVDGYNFLCHKVRPSKLTEHSSHYDPTPCLSNKDFYCVLVCVSRRSSADVVIILKPCWRTTSVRESNCSPSPAPQWLLYTRFPMKYSSTSCITSTRITQRSVHNFCLIIIWWNFLSGMHLYGPICGYQTGFPTARHKPVKKKKVCVGKYAV